MRLGALSPVPPSTPNVLAATLGEFDAYGMMPLQTELLCRPGICVMVAGFQNIADDDPPAATPAKDAPCPHALCSRTANPPAFASAVATTNAARPLQVTKSAFKPR